MENEDSYLPSREADGAEAPPPPVIAKDSRRAWLICSGAFLVQLLIMGVMHVFGVFYLVFMEEFQSGKAKTAWIGSLSMGLMMLFGPLASSMIIRYGPRPVTIVGALLCSSSLIVSSFITDVNVLFITFSVPYGLGNCLTASPTMSMPSWYFERHQAVVTGIVFAGSSFGTLCLAPLTQTLVTHIGWRNTFRVLAGTALIGVWSGWLYPPIPARPRPSLQQPRVPLLRRLSADLYLWRDRVFVVWVICIVLVFFGYYIPYVHLVAYAEDIGVPRSTGSTLLMFFGASTAAGRLLFGKIIELRILDRLHMHQLSMVVVGTGTMLLPLITSYAGLVAYVIVIGLNDGCFTVLLPVMTSFLCGAENLVLAWGFVLGCSSFTYSLGPAVAGWIYDASGSYNLPLHVSGVPIICGAIVLFLIPWAQRTTRARNVMGAALTEPYDAMEPEQPYYSDQEMLDINLSSEDSMQTIRAASQVARLSHVTLETTSMGHPSFRPRSRPVSMCSTGPSPRNLPEAVAMGIQLYMKQSESATRAAQRPAAVPRRRMVSECRPSEYQPQGPDPSLFNARGFFSVPQGLQNLQAQDGAGADDSRSIASATHSVGTPAASHQRASRPTVLRTPTPDQQPRPSGSLPYSASPVSSPISAVPPSVAVAVADPTSMSSPLQNLSSQGQFPSPIGSPPMPSILEEPKGYTAGANRPQVVSPTPAIPPPPTNPFRVASPVMSPRTSQFTSPIGSPPTHSLLDEPIDVPIRRRTSSQNAPVPQSSGSRTNISSVTSPNMSSDWTRIGSDELATAGVGSNTVASQGTSHEAAASTVSNTGLDMMWEELEAPPDANVTSPQPARSHSNTPLDGVFKMSDFNLTDRDEK